MSFYFTVALMETVRGRKCTLYDGMKKYYVFEIYSALKKNVGTFY